MLKTIDLDVGSMPLAGEKWRVVVRDDSKLSPNGDKLGRRWYDGKGSGYFGALADNGLASLQKGWPASVPAAQGAYFVMDVRFSSIPVAMPLSSLVRDWEDRLGGQVVRVKRVPTGETSAAAASDRVTQLSAALSEAPKPTPRKGAADVIGQGLDTLQLLFWTVIIGGLVYLYTTKGLVKK